MRQFRQWWTSALLFLGLLTGAGCGGPKQVEGIVLLDDSPVDGAAVTFIPADEKGRQCTAVTDGAGKFRMRTGSQAGVAPGTYKVVVTKTEGVTNATAPPPPGDPKGMEDYLKQMKGEVKAKSLLPEDYGNPKKTPLTVTVPLETTPLRLELKKK
jgi:hypothetical protein